MCIFYFINTNVFLSLKHSIIYPVVQLITETTTTKIKHHTSFLGLPFKRFPKFVKVILTEIAIKLSTAKAGVKQDNGTATPGSTRPWFWEGNEK